MSNDSSFDFGSFVMLLPVVVVSLTAVIWLVPVLLEVIWHVMHEILVLTLITGIICGIVKKMFE